VDKGHTLEEDEALRQATQKASNWETKVAQSRFLFYNSDELSQKVERDSGLEISHLIAMFKKK